MTYRHFTYLLIFALHTCIALSFITELSRLRSYRPRYSLGIAGASYCKPYAFDVVLRSGKDNDADTDTVSEKRPHSADTARPTDRLREKIIVEYINSKGTKSLALVRQPQNDDMVEVMDSRKDLFSIPVHSIIHLVDGSYTFGDLLVANEMLNSFKPSQIERMWEACLDRQAKSTVDITYISNYLYKSKDPLKLFISSKVMQMFGVVYFTKLLEKNINTNSNGDSNSGGSNNSDASSGKYSESAQFIPNHPAVVQEGLRDMAALREFKQRYNRIIRKRAEKTAIQQQLSNGFNMFPEVPERVEKVLQSYVEAADLHE
jgi:hypothetical protein